MDEHVGNSLSPQECFLPENAKLTLLWKVMQLYIYIVRDIQNIQMTMKEEQIPTSTIFKKMISFITFILRYFLDSKIQIFTSWHFWNGSMVYIQHTHLMWNHFVFLPFYFPPPSSPNQTNFKKLLNLCLMIKRMEYFLVPHSCPLRYLFCSLVRWEVIYLEFSIEG